MDKEDIINILEDRIKELKEYKGANENRWRKIDILEEILFALGA